MPKKVLPPDTQPVLPAAPSSRPPMERMWRIHQELSRGDYPNCRALGDELEVSPKTIMRDIDFMRDRLGLPLDYDKVRHGYFYTAPVRDFPMMKVSQGEVVALLLAQQSLEQFRGTPFERPLAGAFRKLTHALGEEMEIAWHELEDALSVRSGGAGLTDLQVFDSLAKAVMDKAEVEFAYHKLAIDKPEPRTVRPYHLGCIENQWYLFGYDTAREALRTFALPRIASVRRTGEKFKRPKDFSLGKFLEGSFAVFSGRAAEKVRVRFRGVVARLVAERSWHSSQKVRREKDGILLEMKVGLTPEVTQWVLGWGDRAEVLGPAKLRESIARASASMASIYRAR